MAPVREPGTATRGALLGLIRRLIRPAHSDVTGCSVHRARDVEPGRLDSHGPNGWKPVAYGR